MPRNEEWEKNLEDVKMYREQNTIKEKEYLPCQD